MKKRAISPIVATVLVILIVIAAIAIIWAALIPIIKYHLMFEKECLKANANIELKSVCNEIIPEPGLTSYNSYMNFTINRKSSEFNLVDIQIGGSTLEGDRFSRRIISEWNNGPYTKDDLNKPNQGRKYDLDFTPLPLGLIKKFGIAPVISIGKREKVCEMANTKNVVFCKSTVEFLKQQGLTEQQINDFLKS